MERGASWLIPVFSVENCSCVLKVRSVLVEAVSKPKDTKQAPEKRPPEGEGGLVFVTKNQTKIGLPIDR